MQRVTVYAHRRENEPNPKRVYWDDKDCERMNKAEFNAVRALLVTLNYAAYANEDLAKRLECIPHGKQRFAMALGGLRALCDDLLGITTTQQAKQLYNTMKDMVVQVIPKLAPKSQNVVFEKEIAKSLLDMAMEKCNDCVETGETCRKCELYKIMEATTPLDHYGDGLMCPYANATWEE